MKHPHIKTLQSYFDNETDKKLSLKIKGHIGLCDHCSIILSQMAKVDIVFSRSKEIELSKTKKVNLFENAKVELLKKRENLSAKTSRQESLKKRNKKIKQKVDDYKESLLAELKMPIIQGTALLLLCGVFTEFSRTSVEVTKRKVIQNKVRVYLSEQNTEGTK